MGDERGGTDVDGLGKVPPPLGLRDGWAADIEGRHTGGGRHYHTVQHLLEMLDRWAEVEREEGWNDPVASWVAVMLHDAVYVVGAADNEARSAELVPDWVARFARDPARVDVPRVQALILETARHGNHGPLDDDTAWFVDCDMAILAATPPRFAAYEAQVRAEWEPVVGPQSFAEGRRRFFAGLVGIRIFQSDRFHERLDTQAQRNLLAVV